MESVYLIMHQRKPNVVELTRRIVEAFSRCNIRTGAEPWLRERMGEMGESLALPLQACDAVLSVGGDGTFLRANALASGEDKPLLGINVGRVGFLTEVELDGLEAACRRLKEDDYTLDERMMLCAQAQGRSFLALNDVVLSRGGYARLIGVNAWIDSEPVGRFIGDGVIVSTPTGSTGYSLSAGGPIVCPELSCMLITPICAHSLQHRPVVTSDRQTITLRLDADHTQSAMVSVDGQEAMSFHAGQTICITRSSVSARLIRLEPRSFFEMIRIKLTEWSC